MTLFDLKSELKSGAKVRRKCWKSGYYIYLSISIVGYSFRDETHNAVELTLDSMFAEDWEILEEKTNLDAFKELVNGTIFEDILNVSDFKMHQIDLFETFQDSINWWNSIYKDNE